MQLVVTYHPDAAVRDNVVAIVPQVQGLVVVDNGSSEEKLNHLRVAGWRRLRVDHRLRLRWESFPTRRIT